MANVWWLITLVVCSAACKGREPTAQKPPPPAASGDAQSKPAGDLTSDLTTIRDKLALPAIGAAAWRDGKLVELAVVGVRKIGDESSKAAPQDKWHLGSNTKAMTATLIGIFVDRGTMKWTDTIAGVLTNDRIDAGYKSVTLDQLIRHQGGAPESPPDELWKQLWVDGSKPDARSTFVRATLAKPPAQKAGTFVYSNTGYMIAAAMLEEKTKQSWEVLIRLELFDKLGMASCGFGAPGSKATVDQPWGHDGGGTPIAPGPAADNPPGLGPAGTVHCSLEDYGKFLNMVALGTPALVKPETATHLTTAPANGYAGGWMVAPGSLLLHSGSNTMWYATSIVSPAKKLAFVVVTNKGEEKLEEHLERLLRRFAVLPDAPPAK